MTINVDKSRRRKTRKIFYGPPGNETLFWRVKVKPATKGVRINGTLAHALAGVKGSTIGCHLSNCAKANKKAFGHPVLLPVFTRSTALMVTALKDGVPSEAVEYYHDYADLVGLNDTDTFKAYIKANPEQAERSFTLRPPSGVNLPKGHHSRRGGTNKTVTTGEKRAFAPRGALRRAVDAGLLSKPVAEALIDSAPPTAENPNSPSLMAARRALKGITGAKKTG